MNKSESIGKISAALVVSQAAMGNASKGASNPFFKSKYADLNAVREACIPVLNDNKITVLQPTVVQDGKNYVETLLLHESGEFLSSLTEIIANKQNDAQAHGSGVSYARRYGLQSFLCIGAEDDDAEKAHGRSVTSNSKPTQPQATQAQMAADQVKVYENVKAAESKAAEVPAKKTGFGVKKEEQKAKANTEDGWN